VTLTAVNSLITIITIPLIVNFGLSEFMLEADRINAPMDKIVASLMVVIVIPLAIGMFIKKYSHSLASKMDKPVRIASAMVLLLVIVGLLVRERESLGRYFENTWLIALSLNITSMLMGFLTAKLSRLNFRQSLSICIESGNQNGTLAIHIAVISLGSPELAITAAIYSLLMFPTAVFPVMIGNRRRSGKEKEIVMDKVSV